MLVESLLLSMVASVESPSEAQAAGTRTSCALAWSEASRTSSTRDRNLARPRSVFTFFEHVKNAFLTLLAGGITVRYDQYVVELRL